MNRLDLRVALTKHKVFLDENDQPLDTIYLYLAIDGHAIVDAFSDVMVNVRQLAFSLRKSGPYMIFTCTCGGPECANIVEYVLVTHDAATVSWKLGSMDGVAEARFENGVTFDRTQYVAAIERALRDGRRLYAMRDQLGLQLDSDDEFFWGPIPNEEQTP